MEDLDMQCYTCDSCPEEEIEHSPVKIAKIQESGIVDDFEEGFTAAKIIKLCSKRTKLIKKLQEWNLIKTKVICSSCNNQMKLRSVPSRADGIKWFCGRRTKSKEGTKVCTIELSMRSNSFFANSKLTLKQILLFLHYWVSNFQLQHIRKEMELSDTTLTAWNSYCQEVVIDFCFRRNRPIGGAGRTVNIYESKLGNRKYSIQGEWVYGGFCRQTGEIFLVPVKKCTFSRLISLVEQWILRETTIVTDCWKSFKNFEKNFEYLRTNHSVTFDDSQSGTLANTEEVVERPFQNSNQANNAEENSVGSLAKRLFQKCCHVKKLDVTREFLRAISVLYNPRETIDRKKGDYKMPASQWEEEQNAEDENVELSEQISLPESVPESSIFDDNPICNEDDFIKISWN